VWIFEGYKPRLAPQPIRWDLLSNPSAHVPGYFFRGDTKATALFTFLHGARV